VGFRVTGGLLFFGGTPYTNHLYSFYPFGKGMAKSYEKIEINGT